jgi:thioesterase domain-containing protein
MTMEWAVLTEEQDIYLVPGGHRDMLREPYVNVLAEKLIREISRSA